MLTDLYDSCWALRVLSTIFPVCKQMQRRGWLISFNRGNSTENKYFKRWLDTQKVKADLARREDKSSNRSTKKESPFSHVFTVHPGVKHSAIFKGYLFDMFCIVYTLICFRSKIQKYSNRSFERVCNRRKEMSVYDEFFILASSLYAGTPHGVCLIC